MQHDSPRTASDYHRQIADALNDSFLRRTLDKFAVEYRVSRDAVFEEIKGRETIKRIADVKDGAAKHLGELYAQFKAEAEKRGVIVHRASDAVEACKIIAKIAADNKDLF